MRLLGVRTALLAAAVVGGCGLVGVRGRVEGAGRAGKLGGSHMPARGDAGDGVAPMGQRTWPVMTGKASRTSKRAGTGVVGGGASPVPSGYTPSWIAPKGVNSWDGYMGTYDEANWLGAAQWIKANLLSSGFDIVTADEGWFSQDTPSVDEYGRWVPLSGLYPSGFSNVVANIKALGLRAGAWNIRGIPRLAYQQNTPILNTNYTAVDAAVLDNNCGWSSLNYGVNVSTPAGVAWYQSLMQQYVSLGLEFIKIDCMFPYPGSEVDTVMAVAREYDIEVSFSPGNTVLVQNASDIATFNGLGPATVAAYRVTDDFWPSWNCSDNQNNYPTSLYEKFDIALLFQPYIGANGSFPDLDMLPLGFLQSEVIDCQVTTVWYPTRTQFTPDEQLTVLTLWFITRAPLMLGARLPPPAGITYDEILVYLNNSEALDVHDFALNPYQVSRVNDSIVWASTPPLNVAQGPFSDSFAPFAVQPDATSAYVAFFNAEDTGPNQVTTTVSALGLDPTQCYATRDIWNLVDGPLVSHNTPFGPSLNFHASALWKVSQTSC
jgi:alpha-galactosidase